MNSSCFGWSHHNYKAVEHIAQVLTAMNQAQRTKLVNAGRRQHKAHPERITMLDALYGPSTQNVRSILRAHNWRGWGTGGQNPQLWLTEGGARLNARAVHGDKTLQADAVGLAAELLSAHRGGTAKQPQPGQGVEMLTNFLFYSEPGDDSGLRDPTTGKYSRGGAARRPVQELDRVSLPGEALARQRLRP